MASLPRAATFLLAVSLMKVVEGAVTVIGFGGTGRPNKQALTLTCRYTVTPGDVVTSFIWRRLEGNSAVIIASGSVTPQRTVFLDSWQNKGVFVGDYTFSLNIQLPARHVTTSYAGTYRCEVNGLSGSGQVNITVPVLTGPSISGLPRIYTVIESSRLRIDCSTYTTPGNPPTTNYTWIYGGSTVSTGAVLDRSSISRSQGGRYTCIASVPLESYLASVYVDVQYAPSISGLPTAQSVTEFSNLRIDCSTYTTPGNPTTSSYTWTYGGSTVSTETVLDRSSISRSQGGNYTCTASNSLTPSGGSQQQGTATAQVNVNVQYAPSISGLPTAQSVTEFFNLRIDCSTYSTPGNPPTSSYSWTYGGSTVSTGAVLDRSSISRSQGGNYTCTASNTLTPSGGSQQQGTATAQVNVNVQYLAYVVLETQGSATCRPHIVYVGQRNVQLTCRVMAANPAVTSYMWTHNSSVIQSARGAVFTISSVNRTSGGSYTCQGSNILGGSTSSPVTLEVQYGPSVSVVASTQTVTEGQTLTVTCSVDSIPAASVTWTRKDGSSFTPQTGSTLTIRNIHRSQAGTYVCTATNTLSPCGGTALPRSESREMTVDVQYRATVSMFTANSRSGSVTVNESNPVTFRCQIESNPRSVISLLNGTEELTRADNSLTSEYRLESADCRQRGNYSCTATNNIGAPVSQRVELLVKCSPRLDETVPHQLKYAAILGDNVNVSVSVLAYPLPTFTWSRTTSTSQDLTGTSSPVSDISVTARLHLTNLQQEDFGDYRLTVDNGVGKGLFHTVRIVAEGECEIIFSAQI